MAEEKKDEIIVNGESEVKTGTQGDGSKVELNAQEELEAAHKIEEELHEEEVAAVEKVISPPEEDKKGEKEKIKSEEKADEKIVEEEKPKTEPKEDELESTPKKDEEGKSTPEEQVKALNLPERYIQAANRNHLKPQDILDLGERAEFVLEKLAENSDRVSAELGEIGRKAKALLSKKKEEESTLKIEVSEDDSDEVKELKTTIKSLAETVSSLKKSVLDTEGRTQADIEARRAVEVDTFFDSKTNEFPELGNSKSLSKAQAEIRVGIWNLADDILYGSAVRGQKKTESEALKEAFYLYEAKSPKKKVTRESLLNEVVNREKGLIQRPSSKKKSIVQSQDPRKAATKAVADVLNRGKEGW